MFDKLPLTEVEEIPVAFSPQDAVHALVRRMQQVVGLFGWS